MRITLVTSELGDWIDVLVDDVKHVGGHSIGESLLLHLVQEVLGKRGVTLELEEVEIPNSGDDDLEEWWEYQSDPAAYLARRRSELAST